MIIRALAGLRAAQFALWFWVPFTAPPGRYPPQIYICYVLAALFALVFFTLGIRRDVLSQRWVAADVGLAVIYALVVSRSYPPVEADSITNWVIPPLCGVTVTAAIYAGRYRVTAVGVVIAAWVVGAWPAVSASHAAELRSNTTMMVLFAAVAGITGKLLLRAAYDADRAADRAIEAEAKEAAANERNAMFLKVHDNVLQDLEKMAGGAFGVSDQVRRLCAKNAEYLRGMGSVTADGVSTELVSGLARMVRDHPAQETLERINTNFNTLPADLPPEVTEAFIGAPCEALNNVVKHAQANQARLTAYPIGPGGVRVTVTDPGVGFDPDTAERGVGIARSILARMTAVGGEAVIISAPGEGTLVEMTWTP